MAHDKVHGFCESGCKVEVLPTQGGKMTGDIDFDGNTKGIVWTMADGTRVHLRPDIANNLFQLVFEYPNGAVHEAFGIKGDGTPMFHVPLPVSEGGHGASDAANARKNLGITPANIGAAATTHTHKTGDIYGLPDWATAENKPTYTPGEIGIVYSETQPDYVEGRIWLKPV